MDTPGIRGGELPDSPLFSERGHGLFESAPCREGPNWGPLSLERDLLGGIVNGLGRHSVVEVDELLVYVAESQQTRTMTVDHCQLRKPNSGRRGAVELLEWVLELVDVEDRVEGGSPRGSCSSVNSVSRPCERLG